VIRRAFVRALSGAILTTLLGVKAWRLEVGEVVEPLPIGVPIWDLVPTEEGWRLGAPPLRFIGAPLSTYDTLRVTGLTRDEVRRSYNAPVVIYGNVEA
jgi:hypothetical protein